MAEATNKSLAQLAANEQSSAFIDQRVQQATEQVSANKPELAIENSSEQTAALEATQAFQRAVGEVGSASMFLKSGQVKPENGQTIVDAARKTILASLNDIYGSQIPHDSEKAPDLELLEERARIKDSIARYNRPATPEEAVFLEDTKTLFTEKEEDAALASMKAMRDKTPWRTQMPTPEREAASEAHRQETDREIIGQRRDSEESERQRNNREQLIRRMAAQVRSGGSLSVPNLINEPAKTNAASYNDQPKDTSAKENIVPLHSEKKNTRATPHSLTDAETTNLEHHLLKTGDQILFNPELFLWGIKQTDAESCNFFATSLLLLLCRRYPNETIGISGDTQTIERRRKITVDPKGWFADAVDILRNDLKNLPGSDPQARKLDQRSMRLLLEQRQATGNLEIVRPEDNYDPQKAIQLIREGCLPILFIEPSKADTRIASDPGRVHAVTGIGVSQDGQEIIVFDPKSGEGSPPLRRLPLTEYKNRIVVAISATLPQEYSFDSTVKMHVGRPKNEIPLPLTDDGTPTDNSDYIKFG